MIKRRFLNLHHLIPVTGTLNEHQVYKVSIYECFLFSLNQTHFYPRIAAVKLIEPLTSLFELVYKDQKLPGQWLISKIIPIHKKGERNLIENYRPVANLCCVSKIFEKLILKRINELEVINGIFLGGKQP